MKSTSTQLTAFFTLLMLVSANALSSEALYNLVDNHGNTVSSDTYSGKVQVVFFGFAHCKDVCPTSLTTIKRSYDKLDSSLKKIIQPIFITVDPERDTVARVNHFVSHIGDMIGLTGSVENINNALRTFRVFEMQEIGKSEKDYDINHTSLVYLIDATGQPCETTPSDISTEELARMITKVASAKYLCSGFI